jgi:hypothetical protein
LIKYVSSTTKDPHFLVVSEIRFGFYMFVAG